MKNTIKKITPTFLIRNKKKISSLMILIKCQYYDFKRFYVNSAAVSGDYKNQVTLLSAITMDYHRIEKGLIMQETRLKFGLWFIPQLIQNIIDYKVKYGDHKMLFAAYHSLINYIEFHQQNNVELPEIEKSIENLKRLFISTTEKENSIKDIKWTEIQSLIRKTDFKSFALSRYSIRSFKPEVLEKKTIEDAVDVAIKTPSVCNRQPWGVYFLTGKKLNRALSYQNGNAGFRNEIKNLIIIVGKLSFMRHPTERHQIYIDGGLFSMSLIYALHAQEIGTCALNWCTDPKTDKKMRSFLELKLDEEIIMYMALGKVKEKLKVTASPRINAESIITYIN